MSQSRQIGILIITWCGLAIRTESASAQFAIRPDYIGAQVQIPYNGPQTAESQAMNAQMQAMRNEVEYRQLMAQLHASEQYEWQQQQFLAAQQQAQWEAQQRAMQEAQWQASRRQVTQQPQRFVPQNGVRFVNNNNNNNNWNSVSTTRGKQTRITLQPVRDRSGNLYLQVLSVVEEDIDE